MSGTTSFAVVALLVFLLLIVELVAAVLPMVIILTCVAPEERHGLAEVLAAADSRRRLRLWRALRVAVRARRAGQGR